MGREQAGDLMAAVRLYINRHRLLEPGMSVLVAVSGGADSVALLHLLKDLAPEYGWQLRVAHLNHGLRQEAAGDAAFVQKLAHRWGLPVLMGQARVGRLARARKLGVEEAGRLARYSFLRQAARSVGAERIALAHHAGDQVETILLNLIRGSGPAGLTGIKPRNGILVRPLLETSRAEIEGYCRAHGLSWHEDATNFSTAYTRNRIRHQLLPLLEREYNPGIRDALLRLREILLEENHLLDRLTREAAQEVLQGEPGKRISVSLSELWTRHPALRRRLLRLAAGRAGRGLGDLGYGHINSCLKLARDGSDGAELHLPRGLRVRKDYGRLIFTRKLPSVEEAGSPFKPVSLLIPGETALPELGVAIRAEVRDKAYGEVPLPKDGDTACFDLDLVELPLKVRVRQPGDRITLFGLEGSKKLKKLFGDLKIPLNLRHRIPLVTGEREIYWVAGVRRSALAPVGPATRRVLWLKLIRN